jgi:hypothetical protein
VYGAVEWDGTNLHVNPKAIELQLAAMQQQPKVATTGATVALRRMQVTIGKPVGDRIPFQVAYLAEQQSGVQWLPFAQDVQRLFFDIPSQKLGVAFDMHAVLFDDGVLQVKNGQVVKGRPTFTIAGIGTFATVGEVTAADQGDHWDVTVMLKPITILDPKATFHVASGKVVELGDDFVKRNNLTVVLKHSKTNI